MQAVTGAPPAGCRGRPRGPARATSSPNFSARNAPCATSASASSRETASEILSSVTPEQVELVAQHHERRLALRHHAPVGEVARQPQVAADGLGQVARRRRDDGVRLLAAGAEPVEPRRHLLDRPRDAVHARGHGGGHPPDDLLLDRVRGRDDLGRRRWRRARGRARAPDAAPAGVRTSSCVRRPTAGRSVHSARAEVERAAGHVGGVGALAPGRGRCCAFVVSVSQHADGLSPSSRAP